MEKSVLLTLRADPVPVLEITMEGFLYFRKYEMKSIRLCQGGNLPKQQLRCPYVTDPGKWFLLRLGTVLCHLFTLIVDT